MTATEDMAGQTLFASLLQGVCSLELMTVILFTTSAPHPLGGKLSSQGHCVYEALAVSEVFSLAEQHPTASIIITADVDQTRATVIQQHYPTMRLHKQFSSIEVPLN
jgi:hypothetical protein